VRVMNSASRRGLVGHLAIVVSATLISSGCAPSAYKIEPVPVDQTLEETVLINEGGFAPPKIAQIDLTGVLLNGNTPQLLGEGENPVSLLVENLNKASEDNAVKAVLLRINSPGGTVTAADIMYHEILRFRRTARHPKPVVAMIMDVGASGGYYVACGCDEIVANRSSIVGSIGVIMQTFNLKGTLDKIGVQALAIKSGPLKDAGSPWRGMTEQEKRIFQGIIDDFFDRFVEVVADGRPRLTKDKVREIADGRVWTAQQALELGLVDRIGTLRDGLAVAKKMTKAARVRVVTYHRPLGWKPDIYSAMPGGGTVNNYSLLNVNMPERFLTPAPMFLYLWSPGT
jgi:protease-4